jgi:hypothetical protein
MIEVHCHIHESRVLLDWSRVESMRNTDDGPVIDWHCWCGARGSLIAGVRSEPRVDEPVLVDLGDAPDLADAPDATDPAAVAG